MANELRNIKVDLISLVGKAANQRTVIFKSADGSDESFNMPLHNVVIAKTDEEKHRVYGIVYPVNDVDTQGDFAKPEEVEKAMDNFMKSLSTTAKIDTQHNLQIAKGVHIVENWIVRKGDELFPDEKDLGAWAIGVKVENDEVWKAVKDGDYTGFSLYGTAVSVPQTEEVAKSFIKELIKEFKKYFNMDSKEVKLIKDFNSLMGTQEIQDYVWTLSDSIRQALNDETITDKKAQILTNIDQFKEKIDSITLAKSIIAEHSEIKDGNVVMKAGKVLSDANFTKLQAAKNNIEAILAAVESAKTESQKSKNTEMKAEEIQKKIDDAVTLAVKKADDEHTAKITELQGTIDSVKKENDDLKKENEELKKKSAGSGQEVPDPSKVEKSGGINWLG